MRNAAFIRTTVAVLIVATGGLFVLGDALSDALMYPRALLSFPSAPTSYDFPAYSRLLQEYDHAGLIDYRSLGSSPLLAEAVNQLEHTKPDNLKTQADKLAFWINSYNLVTIKQIADCYPLSSAKDLEVAKHGRFIIGGQLLTRHDIQNKFVRPLAAAEEFRAVFLLCSGALGGPPLYNHAFAGSTLHRDAEEMLRWLARKPANTDLNKVDKLWRISQIFKLADNIMPPDIASTFALVDMYLPADRRVKLDQPGYKFLYLPSFDWSLNEAPPTKDSQTPAKPAANGVHK